MIIRIFRMFRHLNTKYCAIGANLISGFFVASSGVFLKLSHSEGNEVSAVFGICGVLINMLYCWLSFPQNLFRTRLNNDSDPNTRNIFTLLDVMKCLVLGGVFSGANNHFYFLSLRYLTMGDAITVSLCVHFVSNLISEILILRIMPHIFTLIAGVLGLGGLMMICQPKSLLNLEFDGNYTTGAWLECFLFRHFKILFDVIERKNHPISNLLGIMT